MKKIFFLIISFSACCISFANHITGGEMFYTLQSQSGNNYTYSVTLKLYRDCFSSGAPLDAAAPIAIYSSTGAMVFSNSITQTSFETLQIGSPDPCINNPPAVCYQVGYYTFTVTLPGSAGGYTIVYQRCCRIVGINNIAPPSTSVGATYSAIIPGTSSILTGPQNNSARFIGADTVIVCNDNFFEYNFGAVDPDRTTFGDSLAYTFCSAINGGSNGAPTPNPPTPPGSWSPIPYSAPFSAVEPLGSAVTLNPVTGLIRGIAPGAGIYVVTVCVTEYRNGVAIATQRKELQLKVGDCNSIQAVLDPEYITCDGFTRTFFNGDNTGVTSHFWDFGVASATNDTSNLASPTFTYPDTGVYILKLLVNRGQPCADSTTAIVRVFPGFFPGFDFSGICVNRPTQFRDTTNTIYGFVNSWRWDFGVTTLTNDTSRLQNPAYTYTQTGTYNVQFIVTSSKGCIDTIPTAITIIDKPPLSVAFKDTLICRGDVLQLQATGNGNFSWTPAGSILSGANTANPTVNPVFTTNYFVRLDDNGCINNDTVRVRVVNFVTLSAMPDTTICATDTIRLRATSDGLQYSWNPAATLDNPNILNPLATPLTNTTYTISSVIGGCTATEDVIVTLVPYPQANAGPDTTICFQTSTQLNGSIVGETFTWTPAGSLSNSNILNPVARPPAPSVTAYILSVTDNDGCPKPKKDTVIVTVRSKMQVSAGRDTAVVVGQPLQLRASGGINYLWVPGTSLNNSAIANPVGTYDGSFEFITYKVYIEDEFTCRDSTTVTVRVFKTNPQIFVPTAFTPNGDKKNDRFTFVPVGISKVEFFRVYNRWGQLVYSTSSHFPGWDGKIGGKEQGTGVYVWIVKGSDFTGKVVTAKGTVTLIR